MDIHNDDRMAFREIVAQIGSRRVVVGAKQIRKILASNVPCRVFLASNADPALTEPLAQSCRDQKIPFAWVRSMSELGSACGIEVGAAAAAAVGEF